MSTDKYMSKENSKSYWNRLKAYVAEYVSKYLISGSYIDKVYPIGSVYISVNNANPNVIIGGTWEEFATGSTGIRELLQQ